MSKYTRTELVDSSRERLKTHSRDSIKDLLVTKLAHTPEEAESILAAAEEPDVDRASVDFFESETKRLYELFESRISKFHNVEDLIFCSRREYIEALADGAIEVNQEEEGDTMRIGTKVTRKNVSDAVVVRYGVVANNHVKYEVVYDPFDGMAAEIEKKESGSEIHHAEVHTPEQKEFRQQLAKAIFVEWYDRESRVICRGWHGPDQLEEVSE
jgi:hypothetical protein